jgi:hypothetical protein
VITRRLPVLLLACLALWGEASASPMARWTALSGGAEEQASSGRLAVTVVDQTAAVIRGAMVAAERDEPGAVPVSASATTNGVGVALIDDLANGRYIVTVRFPGFETTVFRDVRVRGRETRLRATLRIAKLDEAVTVSRDRQSSSLDPRGSAFSSVLTREQIDALPDDPDEMETALKALAPPGSVIRVDGFTGGKLPPKSQIRSIRLPRMDMFAAQNHGGMAGMVFIDIMTMPGNGPVRGNVDFNFLDDALNARNPFVPVKGAEQVRLFGYGLSGTIKPNKTSFSINGGGGSQYTSSSLLAVLPDGSTATDALRQPRDSYNFTARLDHAFTKDHALRARFDRDRTTTRNLGVGGYNLFSRAYDTRTSGSILRLSENGPLGRRMFTETRLQVKWSGTTARSVVEAPTVRVADAFTSGGAQQQGGQHATEIEFASDLDYVRGPHSWRTGALVEGGRYRADDMTNYLGTYTFASLADFAAGRPAAYSRRLGNPAVRYSTWQAAVYLQDDWRIARSVLLSPGVRYGVQGNLADRWNLSPRMSAAWSPLRNGSLTLRASYGYFYDWVAADLYKQSLLIDGYHQRELNDPFPPYPDPGVDGATSPSNRYLWSDGLALPNAHRMTVGVERTLSQNSRANLSYGRGWGRGLLRGLNLNAPAGGSRPDPAFANVVALQSDAASRSQTVNASWSLVRMDLRRLFLMLNYTWSRNESNTAGGFWLPASADDLAAEWGPSMGDVRHRAGASLNLSPVRNLSMGVNVRAQSGMPYNVTTGRDDNRDGVFNDRPEGVRRNSARGAAQVDLGGRLSYALGFGTPRQATGGGGVVTIHAGGGGGLAPGFGGGASDKRYRVEFYVSGQNLLNRANFTAYSFVMTSPFYGKPVAAAQPRKLQLGVRFGF